jgi:hypothetical protein
MKTGLGEGVDMRGHDLARGGRAVVAHLRARFRPPRVVIWAQEIFSIGIYIRKYLWPQERFLAVGIRRGVAHVRPADVVAEEEDDVRPCPGARGRRTHGCRRRWRWPSNVAIVVVLQR